MLGSYETRNTQYLVLMNFLAPFLKASLHNQTKLHALRASLTPRKSMRTRASGCNHTSPDYPSQHAVLAQNHWPQKQPPTSQQAILNAQLL
jgi:hypothetical protein